MYSVPLYNCLKLLADQFHPSIPKQFMIHRFLLLLLWSDLLCSSPRGLSGRFWPWPSICFSPRCQLRFHRGPRTSASTSVLNAEILYNVTASPPPLSLSRSSSDHFVCFLLARLIISGGEGGTERQTVRLHLCDRRWYLQRTSQPATLKYC